MSLQDQLNARGPVVLDPIYYELYEPLIIRAGCHVDGSKGAIIRTHYAGPAFMTPTDQEASHWSIDHLQIQGGGILLNTAPASPSFFQLNDLVISNAACAYDGGSSGAWMGSLRNIHALQCVDGFKQLNGTTMTFENCFAAWGTGKGWMLYNVYAASLRACAMDHHNGQAGYFGACSALSIAAFYMEANVTPNSPIVLFDACDGLSVNGWTSLGNQLSPVAGDVAYLMQANASTGNFTGVSIGGAPRRNPDSKTGPGSAITLLESTGAAISKAGCTITPIS